MSNPYQATFSLRQHTPLVHFHHWQAGATIRATEIKPGLDRFLFQKLGDDINPKWKIGSEDQKALNYSMHIYAAPRDKESILIREYEDQDDGKFYTKQYPYDKPALLGNMGGKKYKDQLKNLVFHKKVRLELFSFYPELLEKLEAHLPSYLAVNNFGNRKTKGFGSFWLAEKPFDAKDFDYKFSWSCSGSSRSEQLENLLTAVNYLYSSLRSGINRPFGNHFYFKSLLWKYMKETYDEDGDKKAVKTHFINADTPASLVDHRNSLGLSTVESWAFKEGKRRLGLEITRKMEGIDRFASPIVFKPILQEGKEDVYNVYVKINEIPQAFKRTAIEVSGNFSRPALTLQPSPNLDLKAYLKYAFSLSTEQLEDHVKAFNKKGNQEFQYETNEVFTQYLAPVYQSIEPINPST